MVCIVEVVVEGCLHCNPLAAIAIIDVMEASVTVKMPCVIIISA